MSKNDIEDINAQPVYVMNATANPLPVSLTTGSLGSISINAEDIEIGAVEIKNSTDDTRATVGANGLHVDVQASSGVGSLTESAPATDTASSGLNGRLQRIAQRLTSLIALIPTSLDVDGFFKVHDQGTVTITGTVLLNAGENHIGEVGGKSYNVTGTFTRPADTTAYAANDTVSNATGTATIITFSNIGRIVGGSGQIVKTQIVTDQSTNTATFRLHLFNTAVAMISDNMPYTALWANRSSRIGSIDIGTMRTEGSGSNSAYAQNITDLLEYICAGGDTNIYGILETLTAFTPASAQNIFIVLTVRVD